VAYAWQLAFGRPITPDEFALVRIFLTQRVSDIAKTLHPDPLREALADLAQQLFSANEFLYVN
jgi:hypothetical protein